MDLRAQAAIGWLLDSDEPAISRMARRDLFGKDDPAATAKILRGPRMSALLADQRPDGGFGVHYYRKWTGALWRLVSLVEREVPAMEPGAVAAAVPILARSGPARRRVAVVDGLVRRHASVDGNVLAVCSRLGLSGDPRVGDWPARSSAGSGRTAAGVATAPQAVSLVVPRDACHRLGAA